MIIHRSKSAQKFAVGVCLVATVVMETTQLVLSQFKNFSYQFRIEYGLLLPEIISKCSKLVKLCHIIHSIPFFGDGVVFLFDIISNSEVTNCTGIFLFYCRVTRVVKGSGCVILIMFMVCKIKINDHMTMRSNIS